MFKMEEFLQSHQYCLPKVISYQNENKGYFLFLVTWGPDALAENFQENFDFSFSHLDSGTFLNQEMQALENSQTDDEDEDEGPSRLSEEASILPPSTSSASSLSSSLSSEPQKVSLCREALQKAAKNLYEQNTESLVGFLELACFIKFQNVFYLFHKGAPSVILHPLDEKTYPMTCQNHFFSPHPATNSGFLPQSPIGYSEETSFQEVSFSLNKGSTLSLILSEKIPFEALLKEPLSQGQSPPLSHVNWPFWLCRLSKEEEILNEDAVSRPLES